MLSKYSTTFVQSTFTQKKKPSKQLIPPICPDFTTKASFPGYTSWWH